MRAALHSWSVPFLALVLMWAVLFLPARLAGGASPPWLPLELPIVLLGLIALPRALAAWWRRLIVLALVLLTLLRLADAGSRAAFGRAFSPVAEWHLVGQGWTLASRTIGRGDAIALVIGALIILALVAVLLSATLKRIECLEPSFKARASPFVLALIALGAIAGGTMERSAPLAPRAGTVSELRDRFNATGRAVSDQRQFSLELAVDPLLDIPAPRFSALGERDVIVLFIESYGRSWVDAERYRDDSRATLAGIGSRLKAAGLAVSSTWVGSPIRGGRSWLAQATLASGLALTNQARFDRLLGSERRSLHRVFHDAGWTSNVTLPVVESEWVEGAWYDVDRFFDGPSLGYAGVSFGFVTMPDQYALSAFQHQVRETAERPLFASVGLLGSHAPWTPLALPVDWDTIGDGAIFDGAHRFGEPLDWARPEPVRVMYGRSVELSLTRVTEYLERHGKNALVLVMGDHQPASVIAGWAPDAAVPLHVVSDDPALLQRLDPARFTDGMIPAADADPIPMHSLREWFATRFEDTPIRH